LLIDDRYRYQQEGRGYAVMSRCCKNKYIRRGYVFACRSFLTIIINTTVFI
jgi:hypothetical protein